MAREVREYCHGSTTKTRKRHMKHAIIVLKELKMGPENASAEVRPN